jgi:hypothetical protein
MSARDLAEETAARCEAHSDLAPLTAEAGASVCIAELVAVVGGDSLAIVRREGAEAGRFQRARVAVNLGPQHVGQSVVLAFERGDPELPIVVGVLRSALSMRLPDAFQVDADGERLVVTARDELVLRCGKASITLTRAGKVMVQGTCVSSRSSGVNRIKGASVDIN